MKNAVHNDATSSNLKGKPMTKTIGLHGLQQVTKYVPAIDEASVHRAQLRSIVIRASLRAVVLCVRSLHLWRERVL